MKDKSTMKEAMKKIVKFAARELLEAVLSKF